MSPHPATTSPTPAPAPASRTTGSAAPLAIAVLLLGLTFAACGPEATDEEVAADGAAPAAAQRVESEALGVAFARVPDGFVPVDRGSVGEPVVEGHERGLEFRRETGSGRMWIEVGPAETAGINVQDGVWAEKERLEAMREGRYLGQGELAGLSAAAYVNRGRFVGEDGERREVRRIVTLHPVENRLLSLFYEYPAADDTEERFDEMLVALGMLEGAVPEEAGGAAAPGAEAAGDTAAEPADDAP